MNNRKKSAPVRRVLRFNNRVFMRGVTGIYADSFTMRAAITPGHRRIVSRFADLSNHNDAMSMV
jgi:hypothetical protein